MKTSARLLRYLLKFVGGVIPFAVFAGLVVVGDFDVSTPLKVGLYFLLFGIPLCLVWTFGRLLPTDPADEVWTEFARDRITEDSGRRWWMVGLDAIGALCLVAGYLGFMMFVLLLTSGCGLRTVLMFITPVTGGIALGHWLRWLARSRCRLCQKRMVNRVSKIHMDGSDQWIVCFSCKIRAVDPALYSD